MADVNAGEDFGAFPESARLGTNKKLSAEDEKWSWPASVLFVVLLSIAGWVGAAMVLF